MKKSIHVFRVITQEDLERVKKYQINLVEMLLFLPYKKQQLLQKKLMNEIKTTENWLNFQTKDFVNNNLRHFNY